MMQWTDYITFFQSFTQVLSSSGLFGNASIDFVSDPDSKIEWPINPPPFIIVEAGKYSWDEEGIGGGRYSHTYTTELKIHLITRNIFDVSFRDTDITTNNNNLVSTYNMVDQIINIMEQSYPTDPFGQLTLIELPYTTKVMRPRRYKQSNDLADITTLVRIKFCELLPSIVQSATPN